MLGKRIIFAGTGEIALPSFQWLLRQKTRPIALLTQPDRPAGRGRKLRASVLKQAAIDAGLEVLQPQSCRDQSFLQTLRERQPDLIIVMAYGQLLPQEMLDLPTQKCVNLHASLLPKYRGAACIQAAIDAGDAETGITLMEVVRKLDAGNVIAQRSLPILAQDTGGSMHDKLAELAVSVLKKSLPALLHGESVSRPQSEMGEASYVPKLERNDGKLDFSCAASRLERRIRAYDPWPGTWCTLNNGSRVKIFPPTEVVNYQAVPGSLADRDGKIIVGCGEQSLALQTIQTEGARQMNIADWWRGQQDKESLSFG